MNWYQDDHFLGFAFFCLCSTTHRLVMNCRLTFCEDSEKDIREFWFERFGYFMNIGDSEFDGLGVEYCPKMAIPKRFHSKQYVHLQASFDYHRYGGWRDDVESGWGDDVESCGIHLIYSQDHQHNHTPLGFHDTQHDEHYYHMPMLLNLPENSGDNRLAAEDINGNFKRSCDDAEHDQAED